MYFRLNDPATVEPLLWLLSEGKRGSSLWPRSTDGWSHLVDFAEANGLGSVAARLIPPAVPAMPFEIADRLVRLDAGIAARALVGAEQARLVGDALHAADVEHYWLKGVAWGESLYSRWGTRPMRDLDFVVAGHNLDRASEVLRSLGFESDPLGAPAGQHLPQFRHASGVKIDVHHRVVPPSIYGFAVSDPPVPWGRSEGLVAGGAEPADALFHLQHMIIHVFHHSFYNLRLMHLFDIKLALEAWNLSPEVILDEISQSMPRRIAADILAMCDTLFDIGGQYTRLIRRRTVSGFLRNGSMPILYPLGRARRSRSLGGILRAEAIRAWFVIRRAPGRFGRATAELHPPM